MADVRIERRGEQWAVLLPDGREETFFRRRDAQIYARDIVARSGGGVVLVFAVSGEQVDKEVVPARTRPESLTAR